MNLSAQIKEYLNNKLFLESHLPPEGITNFYMKIEDYLKNRSSVETFFNNLDKTIEFLEKLELSYPEIITCIHNWPAIIHADKQDLLNKYLLLARPIHYGICGYDRKEILVYHPKDFMTGIDTLSARISFFISEDSDSVVRKESITRRKLFKVTHSEFEESYRIKKEALLEKYPITIDILKEILEYEENKEVVDHFYGNSENIRRGTSEL